MSDLFSFKGKSDVDELIKESITTGLREEFNPYMSTKNDKALFPHMKISNAIDILEEVKSSDMAPKFNNKLESVIDDLLNLFVAIKKEYVTDDIDRNLLEEYYDKPKDTFDPSVDKHRKFL